MATAQIFRSLHRKWTQNAHRRLAAWRRAAFLLRNAEKHRLVLDEAEERRAFATTKRKAHAVSRLATWVRRWHDGKRARAFVRWCRYVLNHEASCLRGGLRADCLRRCLQRGINRWAFHDASAAFRAFRAKNFEAILLLGTAFIILLGRTAAGPFLTDWIPVDGWFSGLRMEELSVYIMQVFNTAGNRAIIIGIALGIASTSLKILMGLDRSYLGGGN